VHWLAALPGWLVTGILIGGALSLFVAAVFLVGARAYPTRSSSGPRRSGETRRRAELRAYLDALGESYAEEHPVDGHTVAFYLPERDVAITFDPRSFYALGAARAVLVEHEMPGAHLGARLPFETPDASVDDGDPTTSADARSGRPDGDANEDANGDVASAYATLGVPAGATSGRLKDAYRERVKETHPDHGGDRESFQAVQQAYAVVSQSHDPDPASATGRGETTGPTTTATEAEIRS
jgi:hypothetical protein